MRRRLVGALLALPLLLALVLAGCTGKDEDDDGIATANEGAADAESGDEDSEQLSEEEMYEARLAFAQCMREHGIEMEDPERGGGGIAITGEDPEAVEAANEECRQLLPNGGEPMEASPEEQARLLEFAQCMRENGIENFPDPQDGGGIALDSEQGLDPMDPEFQAAEETCQEQVGMEPGQRTTNDD